jgi:hypothetical protein
MVVLFSGDSIGNGQCTSLSQVRLPGFSAAFVDLGKFFNFNFTAPLFLVCKFLVIQVLTGFL